MSAHSPWAVGSNFCALLSVFCMVVMGGLGILFQNDYECAPSRSAGHLEEGEDKPRFKCCNEMVADSLWMALMLTRATPLASATRPPLCTPVSSASPVCPAYCNTFQAYRTSPLNQKKC